MFTASKDDNVSNLKNVGQSFRAATSEAMEEAPHHLREIVDEAGHRVRTMIHSAEGELVHARDTVTAQIRTKPLQSGLIALGVGIVLGALLRRR